MRHTLFVVGLAALGVSGGMPTGVDRETPHRLLGRQEAASARSWVAGRNPCSGRMLARYYGLLEAQPGDQWALSKLLRCVSVRALLRRYRRLVRRQPRRYNLHVILGNLSMRQKDYAKAEAAYRAAVRLDPKRHVAHFRLAEALRRRGQGEAARKAYEQALARAKAKRLRKKILRALIDLTISGRNMAASRRYFKALVALEPGNRLLRMEFAQMLARNLRYAEALAEYRALYRRHRGNSRFAAELLKEMGKVYEKMGRDAEAKKAYWRAMRYLTPGHWMRTELYQRIIAIYRRKNALRSLIGDLERRWKRRGFFQWNILSSLYDEVGEDEKAIAAYRAALRIRPHAIDVRARLIALLTRLNRQREAIAVLETQVRLAPGEPRFQLDLAEMLWSQGMRKRALRVLDRLGARFPRDPSVHIALADRYNKWGRPDRALRAYRRLVQIEPGDHGHLIDLGEQYWQRGQRRRALATWKRLLRPGLFRRRDEAFATLAGVYAEHDLSKEAVAYYRRAIALAPGKVAYRRGLALALGKQRQYEAAVAAWQEVIRRANQKRHQPWRREARTAIIDIWHRKGTLRRRLRDYRRRFEARPPSLSAGYFLGEAYRKLKQTAEAERVYRRILEIDGGQVEALLALEQIYRESYRLRKAIAVLERLIRVLPRRAREFHDRIALLYLQLYEDQKAISHATAALRLAKNDATGWARLGAIFEKKEDWSRAVEAYRKAISLNKRLFKVYFALARIYTLLGKHGEAVRLYHEIVLRSADEEFVRRAAQRALDADEYLGRLLVLERDLIPLAFTYSRKTVYRKSLVRLYARLVPRLAFSARFAPHPRERRRARALLKQIGQRALKPLLEALSEKEGSQRDIAIDVLGHLGNRNAAPPLVRLALQPPPEPEPGAAPAPSPTLRRRLGFRPVSAGLSPKRISAQVALKVRALVAAGSLRDPRTAKDLARLMRDPEVAVREAAAWALSLIRDRVAVQALRRGLEDPKVGVQIFACSGLGAAGRPLVQRLLAVVQDRRRRTEVRAACALALGQTRDLRALPVLRALLDAERPLLARKAAWALGLLGRREALSELSARIFTAPKSLQPALAWALFRATSGEPATPELDSRVTVIDGRIDYATHLDGLRPKGATVRGKDLVQVLERAGPRLAQALEETLARHRDLVLGLLQEVDSGRDDVVFPMLGNWPPRDAPPRLRRAAAPLLRALLRALPRLVRHADPEIRLHAVSLVGKLLPRGALATIRGALGDRSASVQRAASEAAVRLVARRPSLRAEVARTVAAGIERLGWQDQRIRLEALVRIGSPVSLRVFQSFARQQNGYLQEVAIAGLGVLRDRASWGLVSAALAHPAAAVRRAAVRAAVRIDATAARAPLERLARSDPSAAVRRAAAAALRADAGARPRPR